MFLLMSVWACQQETPSGDMDSFKSQYLAHSFHPEDSTALVATLMADSLNVPWELRWGADGWLWFTEQKGTVSRLHPETAERKVLLQLKGDLVYQKSRGLLGMALHPDFQEQPYVYLSYTYQNPDTSSSLRVVRYTYREDTLESPFVVMEDIPGETYHNGSRIMIGPDHKLFITTGDAGNMENAQNIHSLSGKVLRLNLDGSIPEDNPFQDNPVWTWGHRNPQGLVWTDQGNLYISDHGPDNDDEVNQILKGSNYGWPDVMGYCDLPSEQEYCADSGIVEPLMAWSPVFAPAGLEYYPHSVILEWQNSLLMGSLKNQSLRVLHLSNEGKEIDYIEEWFPAVFGRIRALCVSPDGDVYVATSNKDWHPRHFPGVYHDFPRKDDDKIIRLSKAQSRQLAWLQSMPEARAVAVLRQDPKTGQERGEPVLSAEVLYQQYCSGCHGTDGEGVEGLYPPLGGTEWVTGNKKRLIRAVLHGLSDPIEVKGKTYNEQMPAYRFLSDKQLSELLTYIRQHFGNQAEAVSPEEVAAERAS